MKKLLRNIAIFAAITAMFLSSLACGSGGNGDWLDGTNDNNNQVVYNVTKCMNDGYTYTYCYETYAK